MKPKLRNIAFEVTSDCNLKCAYCYNHWKGVDDVYPRLNSYKKAKKTLKQLFKVADVDRVSFTGGEPFLSERFVELVLFCRQQGKEVSIISNGNIGKPDDYKKCILLGVRVFQLPILSAQPQIHDQITGIPGSWERSMESITQIRNMGGTVVPVIVLTKMNFQQIGETIVFLNEMGFRQMMMNRYNIGGINRMNDLCVLNKEEANQAFAIADSLVAERNLYITSNVCSPICYLNPSDYPHIGFGFCSFEVSLRPITLNIEGDIRLCNHSPIVAGNIFKTDLNQIFNTEYVKSWETATPELCSNCDFYPKCKGGCRAASEQLGLSLAYPDPIISRMKNE